MNSFYLSFHRTCRYVHFSIEIRGKEGQFPELWGDVIVKVSVPCHASHRRWQGAHGDRAGTAPASPHDRKWQQETERRGWSSVLWGDKALVFEMLMQK